MRYAIVPAHGCYSSESKVRPLRVVGDREKAIKAAEKASREYREALRPYGGTSGGYRVVLTDAHSRRSAVWRGWELDREPSIV